MLRTSAIALVPLIFLGTALAQQDKGIGGVWRTPGGAAVRIAPCSAGFCATLLRLEPNVSERFDGENPDPAKRTQKLCGLRIGYGFHLNDPTHADDGYLYDPKNGKTYRGTMTSNGDKLSLRGYVGIKLFGRTETWTRMTETVQTCS